MQTKLLSREAEVYALVFEPGEEVMERLERFAREHDIVGAAFTAIGAFQHATLAFFDLARNEYDEIPIYDQMEVLALTGNMGRHDGEPKIHAHAVVGLRDGTTRGGHLLRGTVRPTLEVVVTVTEGALTRKMDPQTELPLLDFE